MFRSTRNALFASVVAATLVLAACGDDNNGPSNPTPEPTGNTTFRMRNSSTISAWYIYVRSCGVSSWGTDRLGSAVLSPGESATLDLPAGCYDVHAVSSMEDFKEAYWMSHAVAGDATTIAIADTDWAPITE